MIRFLSRVPFFCFVPMSFFFCPACLFFCPVCHIYFVPNVCLLKLSRLRFFCPVAFFLSRYRLSLDFFHFQHLCCVRHVEAPAGECMICSSPQSFPSSFGLPCCRQRSHYECLARSVHACGDHCTFCTQDLVPVLSDPFLTASFVHLDIPNAPFANSSLNSLCP